MLGSEKEVGRGEPMGVSRVATTLTHKTSWDLPVLICCSVPQSYLTLCDPMGLPAGQASLSFTISPSLLKLMSIDLMIPSNYLLLCHSFLLFPSIFLSIMAFSNESALLIRWPKYWSFSFSTVLPMNIQG